MPVQVHDSKQCTRILPARLRGTAGLLRAVVLILAVSSVVFAGGAHAQQADGHPSVRHFYTIEKRATAPGTTQPDATTVPFDVGLVAAGLAVLAHLSRSTLPQRTRNRPIETV